jgi:molybdopterin-guanine dinucleotide biosynthesis protein A
MPGLGPLGGLITALEWAREMRLRGAFVLGCDMPLVDPGLVGKILDFRGVRKGALVPASKGPLGMEPLCAAYSLDCLGPARELARSGRRSMKALLDSFDFDLIPLEDLGDPAEAAVAFTNVNTVADGMKVEAILESRRQGVSFPDPEQGRGPE